MSKKNEKNNYFNPKYPKIGAMMLKEELDEDGKPQYYIKISDGVEVTVNGVKLGQFINLERPTKKFERMLDKGKITEEEFESNVSRFEDDGDLNYIKFEVSGKAE